MALIDRVKNILLTPKTEWDVINNETDTPTSLLMKHIIPLALIPAVASVLGSMLIFRHYGATWAIGGAVISFIATIVSYFVAAYVIDALANSFGSEKNINKSAQLAAYSMTPHLVAGILLLIPFLGLIVWIAWIYDAYLMYLGLPKLKKTPEDKTVVYLIVSLLVMFLIQVVISTVIGGAILTSMFMTM